MCTILIINISLLIPSVSRVAGIKKEAVPCATHYYPGTAADTGE